MDIDVRNIKPVEKRKFCESCKRLTVVCWKYDLIDQVLYLK